MRRRLFSKIIIPEQQETIKAKTGREKVVNKRRGEGGLVALMRGVAFIIRIYNVEGKKMEIDAILRSVSVWMKEREEGETDRAREPNQYSLRGFSDGLL